MTRRFIRVTLSFFLCASGHFYVLPPGGGQGMLHQGKVLHESFHACTLWLRAPADVIGRGAQLVLFLDRAVDLGTRRHFHRHAEPVEAPSTVAHTLLVWAIKTLLWVRFVLPLMANRGISVSPFAASLGIGGIAIALAAQNTVAALSAVLTDCTGQY